MTESTRKQRDFIARHLINVPRSGIRDFFDIVSTRKDVISLGIGEPDFVTPWHIREASIFALDRGATAYTSNLGLLELRKAIAHYVSSSFGVDYDPATEILVTVGVSEALDLAIRAIVEPGDEIIYHEPCYVSYAPVVQFIHGVPVAIPTRAQNNFCIEPDALRSRITPRTKALLLNSPTNPTGAVFPRKDLQAIAQIATENDLLVLSDDVYSELSYGAERVTIASLPGMKQRTIFLNGFSKSWAMTGFRIGFACAPRELIEAMMKIHQYTMLCAPILAQKAAIEAINHGAAAMEEMRASYETRRNFIHASLNEMGLECARPDGAFYIFPYIGHCGLSSKEFALQLLDKHNVACVPGSAFGACGEGFLRCCYATNIDDIKEAMRRMATFVKSLRK